MKYVRTKEGIFEVYKEKENGYNINTKPFLATKKTRYYLNPFIPKEKVIKAADTIEELIDEIVIIENGNEHNIVYLQEAYDRIDEYHEQGNYEPRLIGRIKVGLDKKAVTEWKENEQGLYDWVLL